jgi:hypothetical protein
MHPLKCMLVLKHSQIKLNLYCSMKQTISDQIRTLWKIGHSKSQIAAQLSVRYQHVQKVLVDAGLHLPIKRSAVPAPVARRPDLTKTLLLRSGFAEIGEWGRVGDKLVLPAALPDHLGVYAFVIDDIVMYVGVAKMGLRKRIYFYANPGPTQKTSLRLNSLILHLLRSGKTIEVLVAMPGDMLWNGLPVHGSAGLEIGLIKTFYLPWNVQGSK